MVINSAQKTNAKLGIANLESLSSCRTCDVTEDENSKQDSKERVLSPDVVVQDKNKRKSPNFLKPEFIFEPEIIHKANLDEATDSNKDAHFMAYVRFWDGMSAVEELLFVNQ
ncbi:hypothetical protein TNCV_2170901 [Trichonephila clavipes]|nr:hypothetical protein TNCV_2170901 [Trichonephila clavipes]